MKTLRLIERLIWRIVTIIDKILFWISFIILEPLLFWIALDFLPKSIVIVLSIFVVFGIIYLKWHLSKKDF